MEFATGRMGMSPKDFWDLDQREFFLKAKGYSDQEYERMMWRAYVEVIYSPYIEEKQKPKTFSEFLIKSKEGKKKQMISKEAFLKLIEG